MADETTAGWRERLAALESQVALLDKEVDDLKSWTRQPVPAPPVGGRQLKQSDLPE